MRGSYGGGSPPNSFAGGGIGSTEYVYQSRAAMKLSKSIWSGLLTRRRGGSAGGKAGNCSSGGNNSDRSPAASALVFFSWKRDGIFWFSARKSTTSAGVFFFNASRNRRTSIGCLRQNCSNWFRSTVSLPAASVVRKRLGSRSRGSIRLISNRQRKVFASSLRPILCCV